MRIHKAGFKPIIVILFLVLLLLTVLNIVLPVQSIVHYFFYGASVLFMGYVVRFFRRPARTIITDPEAVLCSADGTVVAIEKVMEDEFFHSEKIQVSVFMSIFNVHINWYPVDGEIIYMRHHDGRHYPAYTPKSSLENEMTTTVIRDEKGREIMVRQIAGIMARRIVSNARVGKSVKQGEEIGIIKFGSRVDLLLPPGMKVKVEVNQKVRGGKDIIASC